MTSYDKELPEHVRLDKNNRVKDHRYTPEVELSREETITKSFFYTEFIFVTAIIQIPEIHVRL